MEAPSLAEGGYRRILLALDNSKHSSPATRLAVALASSLGAGVAGVHVYAARLHETRFIQMEPGLPRPYADDAERLRQRSIHDSLISKGLRLVSESYLSEARAACAAADVPFESRLLEGRHYEEILREALAGGYDLVVLGALGLGARHRSVLGSVSARVLRGTRCDVLVAHDRGERPAGVMVATDGSPHARRAIARGLALGQALAEPVEVVTVYDPHFHVVAFQRLAAVLSEEAAAVFRFREQQRLHTEIIDGGLARLYQGHLRAAEELAAARGQTVRSTLLKGKAFPRILAHVERRRPRILVAGRFGQHVVEGLDIGSTTENLVRLAACPVLVVSGSDDTPVAPPEAVEKPTVPWTPEAEALIAGVTPFAHRIVRQAVEAYAHRRGEPLVTAALMGEARAQLGW